MNKTITKIVIGSFVLVFLVSVGIFFTQRAQKNATLQPLHTSLRLKWLYDPGFAGEMVAAKKGFFQKHGITVDIHPGGFEADPIKLVASGSDTFGVAGVDSFLLARAKGVPIVAFAAGYIRTPVVYYVHSSSTISTPADFIGKKVGYQAGQDTATVYEALLAMNNVDRSKVKEIPVNYDMSPFISRQVDVWPGYAADQSYVLQQKNIPYRIIKPETYGLDVLGTVYFTTESFIEKHPEAVQAFVDGKIEGWDYVYGEHEDVVPLIASYDSKSLTPELIQYNLSAQKETLLPEGSRFGEFTEKDLEKTQAVLISQKLLDAPVDLKSAFTTTFLENHNR